MMDSAYMDASLQEYSIAELYGILEESRKQREAAEQYLKKIRTVHEQTVHEQQMQQMQQTQQREYSTAELYRILEESRRDREETDLWLKNMGDIPRDAREMLEKRASTKGLNIYRGPIFCHDDLFDAIVNIESSEEHIRMEHSKLNSVHDFVVFARAHPECVDESLLPEGITVDNACEIVDKYGIFG
jgi:hypothetical protein